VTRSAGVVLSSLLAGTLLQPPRPAFDIILRHGTVIDGSGLPRVRADVAIANGFIARIGDLSKEHAELEIDARGLFVAPGFINIHSHASPPALPRAENMLTQGVTTEILNPDGGGSTSLGDQLAGASAPGLAVNIGAYVGFNAVWSDVMGPADRRATPEGIEKMCALIVRGLEDGAWGVSAGLDYKPAYYAQIEVGVLQTADKWASFTARVRGLDGEPERSALVIVDQEDPFAEGKSATVLISIEGLDDSIRGELSPTAVDIRTAAPPASARRRE